MKLPIPSQTTDALIGDEEQNENGEKNETEKRIPNLATLDHLVASYDPHGSYDGTIDTSSPQGYIYIFFLRNTCDTLKIY